MDTYHKILAGGLAATLLYFNGCTTNTFTANGKNNASVQITGKRGHDGQGVSIAGVLQDEAQVTITDNATVEPQTQPGEVVEDFDATGRLRRRRSRPATSTLEQRVDGSSSGPGIGTRLYNGVRHAGEFGSWLMGKADPKPAIEAVQHSAQVIRENTLPTIRKVDDTLHQMSGSPAQYQNPGFVVAYESPTGDHIYAANDCRDFVAQRIQTVYDQHANNGEPLSASLSHIMPYTSRNAEGLRVMTKESAIDMVLADN